MSRLEEDMSLMTCSRMALASSGCPVALSVLSMTFTLGAGRKTLEDINRVVGISESLSRKGMAIAFLVQ